MKKKSSFYLNVENVNLGAFPNLNVNSILNSIEAVDMNDFLDGINVKEKEK